MQEEDKKDLHLDTRRWALSCTRRAPPPLARAELLPRWQAVSETVASSARKRAPPAMRAAFLCNLHSVKVMLELYPAKMAAREERCD